MKYIIILITFFAFQLQGQHITDFFDSIPGLSEKYNDAIQKHGTPDSVVWMKEALKSYRLTGLERNDAFAIYFTSTPKVVALLHIRRDQYWDQDGNGFDPPRLDEYTATYEYLSKTDRHFRYEFRKALPGGVELEFGAQKNWDQFIGQPIYTVKTRYFNNEVRLEMLKGVLIAFKYEFYYSPNKPYFLKITADSKERLESLKQALDAMNFKHYVPKN